MKKDSWSPYSQIWRRNSANDPRELSFIAGYKAKRSSTGSHAVRLWLDFLPKLTLGADVVSGRHWEESPRKATIARTLKETIDLFHLPFDEAHEIVMRKVRSL